MNRKKCLLLLAAGLVSFGAVLNVCADRAGLIEETQTAIGAAEKAVEAARADISRGKELIARIPEDSPLMLDVMQMLEAASENWTVAVESLEGAKKSAQKIESAPSDVVAEDFSLLSRVNAAVAVSGAKVVQIGLVYVEAVANEKTESLDLIRSTMQDALASTSQVQFNYERIKTIIAEKYSK